MLSLIPPAAERSPAHAASLRAKLAIVVLFLSMAAAVSGCAASAALRNGRDAERQQDFDRAVVEYTKAVRLNPDDTNARVALERAKLRAATEHFQRGRRFAASWYSTSA
jgi:Ni/Co efflux regulator RcnB